MMQPYAYASPYVLSGDWEAPPPAYKKLIGCLCVSVIAFLVAGVMYLFTKDPVIPVGLAGVVVVVLTLYHTPFGLFVLFSFFAIDTAVVLSPYFTISKAMGIVVAVSFLLHVFSDRLVVTTPLKLTAVLIAWALASSLWSLMPVYTAGVCLTFILNAALIVIVVNSVKDPRTLYLVLCGFVFGSLVASCVALAGHGLQASHRTIERAALGEGSYSDPVILALALGMGFLATSFTFFQKGTFKKIIALALLALFFVVMVRTQSRMPTLAAISAPVIALILSSKSQHRFKYLMIAGFAALVAFLAIQVVLASGLLSAAEKERVFSHGLVKSGRLVYWRMGFHAFVYRPLHGYGANNFWMIPGNPGFAAHNNVVALAVDLGLVGLGLAVTILVVLYRQVRSLSDIRLKWLGLMMLLYPVMTGMTVTNYTKREFWYSVAIAMAAVNIGRRQEQQSGRPPTYGYVPKLAGPGS